MRYQEELHVLSGCHGFSSPSRSWPGGSLTRERLPASQVREACVDRLMFDDLHMISPTGDTVHPVN